MLNLVSIRDKESEERGILNRNTTSCRISNNLYFFASTIENCQQVHRTTSRFVVDSNLLVFFFEFLLYFCEGIDDSARHKLLAFLAMPVSKKIIQVEK